MEERGRDGFFFSFFSVDPREDGSVDCFCCGRLLTQLNPLPAGSFLSEASDEV